VYSSHLVVQGGREEGVEGLREGGKEEREFSIQKKRNSHNKKEARRQWNIF
jgi:hypothetical protein